MSIISIYGISLRNIGYSLIVLELSLTSINSYYCPTSIGIVYGDLHNEPSKSFLQKNSNYYYYRAYYLDFFIYDVFMGF